MGFAIYGKKQDSMIPLCGGLVMIACSYFIESAMVMSVVSVVLIALIVFLCHRGIGE